MKETKFKQTEVGMIPSDWGVEPLANIANTASGGTPSRSNEAFYKGSIKWFTTTELKDCNLYDSVEHISKQAVECSSAKIFPKNTLLMAMYGATIGKLGLLKCDAATNQACCAIFPKKTDVLYLYYFLLHNRENIIAMGCGAGQPNVSQEIVKKINIPLPPTIEEQQRIANALSDVDTLIESLEKLIAKKKNIKQGAMQQLLTGRKRLPGFAPAKPTYKQTELGKIPTDWEFVPVSELAKDMADGPFGSNLKKEHYTSDPQARIIQLSNIGENGWEDENTKYTTFEHAKTIARCIVPKEESILVAKMMPAGRAIICPKIEKQYVLGSDVIRITANEKLNSKYFVYASKSDVYLKQISDNTQGSTRQRTSISKLRKILILLPSLDEQTAIANILSDMDTEIATLETKLAKYRKLKTGMMQQLLTGKIRLI